MVVSLPPICLRVFFRFERRDPIKKLITQYPQAPNVHMIIMFSLLDWTKHNRYQWKRKQLGQ
jgi:ribosomal protein L21E